MEPRSPTRRRLLSDVDGRISHVFFAIPGYDPEIIPPVLDCIRSVRAALGPGVRYSVLHHESQGGEVSEVFRNDQIDAIQWAKPWTLRGQAVQGRFEGTTLKLGTVSSWADFTPWVQDSFLVSDAEGAPCLLASPRVERPFGGLDEDVPAVVASWLGWRCEVLASGLEAANVLVDRRHVVVGSDVVADKSQREIHELLASFGAKAETGPAAAVLPADRRQPIAHQDLYLTLAGNRSDHDHPVAVVGSQHAAAAISGEAFVSDEVEDGLDAVASGLARLGYDVARVPLRRVLSDDAPGRCVSYNNVLVEIWTTSDGSVARRIIMPAYGTDGGAEMAELDHAAAGVWKDLGFEVRFAEGPFWWLAQCNASLRCMTKVLARS